MGRLTAVVLCAVSMATVVLSDVNSGCPQWGCLSWGSFSLSADIPASGGKVKWSREIEALNSSDAGLDYERGCVSNQDFVVCTTYKGYTSLDPMTGDQLWNYTGMTSPFLPNLDIYGDVIGIDKTSMYYVGNDGTPKHPIGLKILHCRYGQMISNNSKILLTGSLTKTAQLFTYDPDGIIDAAYELRGSWERTNGTFVPYSHPIIAGQRLYLVTNYVPNKGKPTGWLKLYAVDLLSQMAPRIWTAWSAAFMPADEASSMAPGLDTPDKDPIVTFFNNTIYTNRMMPSKPGSKEPYSSVIFAFRDDGPQATRLFQVDSQYGPMAVYDTYDEPIRGVDANTTDHVLWVASNSPAKLTAHSTQDGSVKQVIDVGKVSQLGNNVSISSKLTITRRSLTDTDDILVMGLVDGDGQAYVVALQATVSSQSAKVVLTTKVSESRNGQVSWKVEGQVVNTVQPDHSDPKKLNLGLLATVSETGSAYKKTHVKAIF